MMRNKMRIVMKICGKILKIHFVHLDPLMDPNTYLPPPESIIAGQFLIMDHEMLKNA